MSRMLCRILVLLAIGHMPVLSGCWKYNLAGMHSGMSPKQIFNEVHPPIEFGDTSRAVLNEMDDFYVMRMEDVHAEGGERVASFWLRPPGWSYRGPGKYFSWGVGEPVNFIFDADNRFIAINKRGQTYPDVYDFGILPHSKPREN